MKNVILFIIFFFTLTIIVSAQDSLNQSTDSKGTSGNRINKEMNEENKMSSTSSANEDDIEFIEKTASSGMLEVELGKLAQQKGTTEAVKEFGRMMVKDHTKANNELKNVARKNNIEVPTTFIPEHQEMYSMLNGLSAEEFDEEYIDHMVEAHEKDISTFEDVAESSSNEDIKNFAQKNLPVLKKHLERVKSLSETVARGDE